MAKLLKILDNAEEVSSVIFFSIMSVIVLWAVICRFILKIPFSWGEESARYLMIYGIFIGISIAVRTRAHLGVEAFMNMMPARFQKSIDIFSNTLCVIIYIVLFYLSVQLTMQLYGRGQTSAAMQIPMWLAYLAMPIGLFLSSIRSFQTFVETLKKHY